MSSYGNWHTITSFGINRIPTKHRKLFVAIVHYNLVSVYNLQLQNFKTLYFLAPQKYTCSKVFDKAKTVKSFA